MIEIISENDFFIILFKPHGISVHNQSPSLLDFLNEKKMPAHFINRLDSETSGLVVVAKNELLHKPLQKSLHDGIKKYRALVCGSMNIEIGQNLIWNWSISDKAEGRKNPQGEKNNQKESLTEVRLVRKNKYFSELEITLKTGRQHQIRKHSALAKHSLVGDNRYGNEKYNLKISNLYKDSRMQLEAEELNFKFNNQDYHFKCNTLKINKFFLLQITTNI